MDGKEAIIAEIIEKAEKSAEALIADANAERDEILKKVESEESARKQTALDSAREAAEAVISRRATLSGLETRKAELAAKQNLINAAFEEAAKKILNMTDHIYREFIGEFVVKYADDGDKIIIAERDEKRLHAEWLDSLCRKTGKSLSFSEDKHKGKGGIILSGKLSDKNFTLETMMGRLRENCLTDVAKKLFKGKI